MDELEAANWKPGRAAGMSARCVSREHYNCATMDELAGVPTAYQDEGHGDYCVMPVNGRHLVQVCYRQRVEMARQAPLLTGTGKTMA